MTWVKHRYAYILTCILHSWRRSHEGPHTCPCDATNAASYLSHTKLPVRR